jgi:ABC-2 type transport system permease protein
MITHELRWTPFLVMLEREVKRFGKVVVQTVVTPLINSSLYLLIFGVSLGQSITLASGVSYLAFLIPGLVMMGCLNNAFQNSSSSIVSSRFGGDLEDYRVSPLSHQQIIWALAIGGLIRGLVVGSITFLVGQVFFYFMEGQVLGVAHPFILLFFICLGGLSFATLGISVAFWAKTFDQMSAISAFILLPLLYLGGVFFSIESLHPLWKSLALLNPLLYLINGVRYGILGVADVPVGYSALIGAIGLVVFHFIAVRSLKNASFSRW